MRRPSPALVVALAALFVALGGPAQAARLITGKQIKNHSVTTLDLTRATVRKLRTTPADSITSKQVRDHTLSASDVAQFAGSFTAAVPAIVKGSCWSQERRFTGADISNSVVLVTPGSAWPREQLAFTVQNSPNADGFIISGCNRALANSPAASVVFRYIIFQLP
jgi:hypothetical protein